MSVFRHNPSVRRRAPYLPSLAAVVVVAGHLAWLPAHAATLGHSRLVSAVGEPLRITIPVTQISTADIESLRVVPAALSEWSAAGLTPPVDPATLQTRLTDGFTSGTHVIQMWSDQTFNQPIADLLLDIHTASGVQRYQVSLLARGGATAIQAPAMASADGRTTKTASEQGVSQAPILVRRGDTMFAIAQRHAVPGVTVYQMMMALHRTNPRAFIHDNINLVKAGEQLVMPDMDALTAISDREARRLFHEQVVAFNAYRQGQGDPVSGDPAAVQPVTQADPDGASPDSVSNIPPSRTASGDQLRLSGGRSSGSSASENSTLADGSSNAVPQTNTRTASSTETAIGLAQNMAAGVSNAAHASPSGNTSVSGGTAGLTAVSEPGKVPEAGRASDADVVPEQGSDTVSSQALAGGSAAGGTTTAADTDAAADDALATRHAIQDAEQRVSQLEENVKNLNRALQSQGEAAKDVVIDGAIGLRQSLTDVATAVTEATIGDNDFLDDPAASEQDDAASAPGVASPTQQSNATPSTMESIAIWLHTHFVGVVTALLALFVLVIAWVLRRANVAQSRSESAITPEMVKEKLDEISLDLNEPTVGDRQPRS